MLISVLKPVKEITPKLDKVYRPIYLIDGARVPGQKTFKTSTKAIEFAKKVSDIAPLISAELSITSIIAAESAVDAGLTKHVWYANPNTEQSKWICRNCGKLDFNETPDFAPTCSNLHKELEDVRTA